MSTLIVRDNTCRSVDIPTSECRFVPYRQLLTQMQSMTRARNKQTSDEIWVLEHQPVYTLGQAGKEKHVIDAGNIPVIKVDRGGQVTYHGPGQIMFYVLVDLPRLGLGVRSLVEILETSIVNVLVSFGIFAVGDRRAPGVYVDGEKIAAIGLRVSRGCSYHGLCFNYCFDAEPFLGINPCGYEDLKVTQLADLLSNVPKKNEVVHQIIREMSTLLGYDNLDWKPFEQ